MYYNMEERSLIRTNKRKKKKKKQDANIKIYRKTNLEKKKTRDRNINNGTQIHTHTHLTNIRKLDLLLKHRRFVDTVFFGGATQNRKQLFTISGKQTDTL